MNNTTLANNTNIFWEAFRTTLMELMDLLPRIFIALLIVFIYIIIIRIVNNLISKLIRVLHIEEAVKPLMKEAYISLSKIIIVLADIGIVLLAIYSIVYVLFPEQLAIANTILVYTARYASVVFIILFSYIVLNSIVRIIRAETKIRGFVFLLLLYITMLLTIDITALSETVKEALVWGISIGISVLISSFSIWYFFHEIWEKRKEEEK